MSTLKAAVSKALIKELEDRFPPRKHALTETLPEIMHYAGQLELIEYLRRSHEAQQNPENAFKTPIR